MSRQPLLLPTTFKKTTTTNRVNGPDWKATLHEKNENFFQSGETEYLC